MHAAKHLCSRVCTWSWPLLLVCPLVLVLSGCSAESDRGEARSTAAQVSEPSERASTAAEELSSAQDAPSLDAGDSLPESMLDSPPDEMAAALAPEVLPMPPAPSPGGLATLAPNFDAAETARPSFSRSTQGGGAGRPRAAAPKSSPSLARRAQAAKLQAQTQAGSGRNSDLDNPVPKRFSTPAMERSLPSLEIAEQVSESFDAVAPMPRSTTGQAAAGEPVSVFFATDRRPIADLMPSSFQLLGPALAIAMLFCMLLIGFLLSKRMRVLWLLSCSAAAAMTFLTGHSALIRWQQMNRLTSDVDTVFSAERYQPDSGYPLHLGRARITLPPNHSLGQVEKPVAYKFEFRENAAKHVVLHRVQIEDTEQWFKAIRQQTHSSGNSGPTPLASGEGAFVFVHGFNVRFDDALKRTAQLSTDLGVRGPAICFSWPSRGQVAGYTADESTVDWSAPHFERLLLDLRSKSNCKSINVIAHSMGNRAMLQAVERIGLRLEALAQHHREQGVASTATQPIIDQLVMAAPDVDVNTFSVRYREHLQRVARRSTLYFSATDRALWLSKLLHGGKRVGLAAMPDVDSQVDVIDIGAQSFFSLGHSYYGSDPAVISDLAAVLLEDQAARDRPWLDFSNTTAGYWQLNRPLAAQSASRLLR